MHESGVQNGTTKLALAGAHRLSVSAAASSNPNLIRLGIRTCVSAAGPDHGVHNYQAYPGRSAIFCTYCGDIKYLERKEKRKNDVSV